MKFALAFSVLILTLVHIRAKECPEGFFEIPGTSSCYSIEGEKSTLAKAYETCRAKGDASLISIDTPGEFEAVKAWLLEQPYRKIDGRMWVDAECSKPWEHRGPCPGGFRWTNGLDIDPDMWMDDRPRPWGGAKFAPDGIALWREADFHLENRPSVYKFGVALCEANLDPCIPNPCRNDGTCSDGKCTCKEGFLGAKCDIALFTDPCKPNPCQNNGTCTKQGTQSTCTCEHGFSGEQCETKDPCIPNPCMHDGVCEDGVCTCAAGYIGDQCQEVECVHENCVECNEDGSCLTCGEGFQVLTEGGCGPIPKPTAEYKCKKDRFLADPAKPTWVYPGDEQVGSSPGCSQGEIDEEGCEELCTADKNCLAYTWRGDGCCYLSGKTHHEDSFALGRGSAHNSHLDYMYCFKIDGVKDHYGFFNWNETAGRGPELDRSGLCVPEGGSLDSREYRGTNSVTRKGAKCKPWTWEKSPQTADDFPYEETLEEAKNYCRDPDFTGYVWCYTGTDWLGIRQWDYCDIPSCNQNWRFDLRCGPKFPLPNGEPAQCSPTHASGYSCCSPGGWCGKTRDHCNCAKCVDYKKANECDARVCGYGVCSDKTPGYTCDCTGAGSAGENCNTALFRDDLRCGPNFLNILGEPAQCDPNHPSGYSCCSDAGYCGNTEHHCNCRGCTDYRN